MWLGLSEPVIERNGTKRGIDMWLDMSEPIIERKGTERWIGGRLDMGVPIIDRNETNRDIGTYGRPFCYPDRQSSDLTLKTATMVYLYTRTCPEDWKDPTIPDYKYRDVLPIQL